MLCSLFFAPVCSNLSNLSWVFIPSSNYMAWIQSLFSLARLTFYLEINLPKLCFPPCVTLQLKNLHWCTSSSSCLMEHQGRRPSMKRVLWSKTLGKSAFSLSRLCHIHQHWYRLWEVLFMNQSLHSPPKNTNTHHSAWIWFDISFLGVTPPGEGEYLQN